MEHTVINIFGAIVEYFAIYAFLWIFFDINPDRCMVLGWKVFIIWHCSMRGSRLSLIRMENLC